MKNKKYLISECCFCRSKNLKEKKEYITNNGNSTEIDALECQKCGETYYTMDDTERARKELNPSFTKKIKNLFTKPTTSKTEIFRNKIL